MVALFCQQQGGTRSAGFRCNPGLLQAQCPSCRPPPSRTGQHEVLHKDLRMCRGAWSAHVLVCACLERRGEVLAASLGTYKPCGRICLRCQLKAFSNVHPTPSPGKGKSEDSGTQSYLLLPSPHPCPGLGAQLEPRHHPLSWPSLSPGGPKAAGGGQQLPHPSPPWGKAKNPVPSRPPSCNCYGNIHKMGLLWLC